MPHSSTTVRVSQRAHRIFSDLAVAAGIGVADYLDRLAERERRGDILARHNARLAELLAEPTERDRWAHELGQAEVSAQEMDLERDAPVTR